MNIIVTHTPIWAACLLVIHSTTALTTILTCIECSSSTNGEDCPATGFVMFPEKVKTIPCFYGACYSTLEKIKGTDVSFRGCTNDLQDIPYTLPQEGAYTWHGKSINVCFNDMCNILPPVKSSGKSLDDHLKHAVEVEARGPIECFQCMNYDLEGNQYTQCPKDEIVDNNRAYAGECNTTCFTRTFGNDPNRVARGCSDTQWGLPYPLPPDGCYNWEEGVWCVCNTPGCNGRPISRSSGKELDDHLYTDKNTVFEEKDGLNRCYECINYDDKGTYYKQCPKHKRVRNAYLSVCNGSCFTHSYDYDERKVARGCTDTQWGLPDPLPPDGCYKWYSEVWCVCSKTRCNRNPIGNAQDIEFDSHITKGGRGGVERTGQNQWLSFFTTTSSLFLTLCYKSLAYSD